MDKLKSLINRLSQYVRDRFTGKVTLHIEFKEGGIRGVKEEKHEIIDLSDSDRCPSK